MANLTTLIGIYKVTSPKGKIYIGQSWDILSRFGQHKREKRPLIVLNRSIIKYGYQSHIFEIAHLLPSDITQKTLDTYEQIYIDFYKESNFIMLNMKDAGSNGKMSIEARSKMSIANKGRKPWNTGLKGVFKHSKDAVQKIIDAHTGRKNTPETLKKMSLSAMGRKHTAETLKKLSDAKKGKPSNRLGKKNTEIHIRKIILSIQSRKP